MSFDWSEDAVTRLRALWASGESTAAIGRALGCGKDAAIGKARRLRLPGRPSPIHRSAAVPPPAVWCCFPLGEPLTPSFRFCRAPCQPGCPFCAPHRQLAYVAVPADRDAPATAAKPRKTPGVGPSRTRVAPDSGGRVGRRAPAMGVTPVDAAMTRDDSLR